MLSTSPHTTQSRYSRRKIDDEDIGSSFFGRQEAPSAHKQRQQLTPAPKEPRAAHYDDFKTLSTHQDDEHDRQEFEELERAIRDELEQRQRQPLQRRQQLLAKNGQLSEPPFGIRLPNVDTILWDRKPKGPSLVLDASRVVPRFVVPWKTLLKLQKFA